MPYSIGYCNGNLIRVYIPKLGLDIYTLGVSREKYVAIKLLVLLSVQHVVNF